MRYQKNKKGNPTCSRNYWPAGNHSQVIQTNWSKICNTTTASKRSSGYDFIIGRILQELPNMGIRAIAQILTEFWELGTSRVNGRFPKLSQYWSLGNQLKKQLTETLSCSRYSRNYLRKSSKRELNQYYKKTGSYQITSSASCRNTILLSKSTLQII